MGLTADQRNSVWNGGAAAIAYLSGKLQTLHEAEPAERHRRMQELRTRFAATCEAMMSRTNMRFVTVKTMVGRYTTVVVLDYCRAMPTCFWTSTAVSANTSWLRPSQSFTWRSASSLRMP